MAKKTNNAELELRYNAIVELVLEGMGYNQISQYCEKKYKINSSNTVTRYIKHAKKIIRESSQDTTEQLRADTNAKYDDLYRRLYTSENPNYYACAKILQMKSKINGLEVQKIEADIKGEIKNKVEFSLIGVKKLK